MSSKTAEKTMEWLEEHLSNDPMQLPQTSNFVGYSENCCIARSHGQTCITFNEYLAKQKLSAAAQPPKSSESRFIDIALDCGFTSTEAFSKVFIRKKRLGRV